MAASTSPPTASTPSNRESAEQPDERRPCLAEGALVAHRLEVIGDDLGLVPAAVAALLQRAEDRSQREDALAEERTVHRPHRDPLVVAHLHGVDAPARVATDRVEKPA